MVTKWPFELAQLCLLLHVFTNVPDLYFSLSSLKEKSRNGVVRVLSRAHLDGRNI